MKHIQPVAVPFQRWGIDAVQNLIETKSGMKHILTAVDLEDMGEARAAAFERSRVQGEAIRRRNDISLDSPDHFFKVGDLVKMKHHSAHKFEFRWKGPYHVVDLGFPGT